MSLLLHIQWIPFLALDTVLLAFVLLRYLDKKGLDWTLLMLLSLVLGAGIGILFASDNNRYLAWVDLIGQIYIRLITLLVAPVISLSIISGFISLGSLKNMKTIGLKSVFWLLIQSGIAAALSLAVGLGTGLGKNAAGIFAGLEDISETALNAYSGITHSFQDVLLSLFPANVLGDLVSNNVPGIIMVALALAIGYIVVADREGEAAVSPFRRGVEALKKVVFSVTSFIMDLTPYAVLALVAGSASSIFSSRAALGQLLLLVGVIYAPCAVFTYLIGGALVRWQAKVNPFRFFQKIFPAQVTAFTTQASVGTLPVTLSNLRERVGVSDQIANFTAPLGTTIGMPGCTVIWPVLLALFYLNATGQGWGFADYATLFLVSWFLSVGSAGVPGIAVVSAVALFNALGLPIGAVILLIPINTVSDMIRTLTNVSSAAVASTIVARKTGQLDDKVFQEAR